MKYQEVLDTLQRLIYTLRLQYVISDKKIEDPSMIFTVDKDNCVVFADSKKLFDIDDIKSIGCDMSLENGIAEAKEAIIIERRNGDKLYIEWKNKSQKVFLIEKETGNELCGEKLRRYFELYHADRLVMLSVQHSMTRIDFGNIYKMPVEEYQNTLRVLDKVSRKFIDKTKNKAMLFAYCDLAFLNEDKYEECFSEQVAISMLQEFELVEAYILYFEDEYEDVFQEGELEAYKIQLIEKLLCK